jgi:hypothetical protein
LRQYKIYGMNTWKASALDVKHGTRLAWLLVANH